MRPKLLLLSAIMLLSAAAIWLDYSAQYAPALQSKSTAISVVPNFSFPAIDTGKTHSINDFKGKTVLINFWATWCMPCRVEFPTLISLAERHPDKLVLLLMSVNKAPQDAFKFAQKKGVELGYPASDTLFTGRENIVVGWDKKFQISNQLFHTYKFPESYIINPDQTIRRKLVGAITEFEIRQLEEELAQ